MTGHSHITTLITQGIKPPVISDFRYIMKNMTGGSCQGVIFSVPLDMILYSGYNARRFGQSKINLSDLIFKRNIIPYKADEPFVDTESVDTGLIRVNAKFQSFWAFGRTRPLIPW